MKYIFLLITTFVFAQQTKYVDFKTVSGQLTINDSQKTISGYVDYEFDVLQPIDTIKIDGKNMEFTNVQIDGKDVIFLNTTKELQILNNFQKGNNHLTFNYNAKPKQALYFVDIENNEHQIWTQGQGRYTSNWFPSFDDVNEKVIFNIGVTYKKDYQVVSNGVLKSKTDKDDQIHWQYQMENPMSSYLLVLSVGKYERKDFTSKSKIPLEYYLEKKDTARFEPTYRYSKRIFDFLEKEIGVKYPWKVFRQIPVRDFLYAGMENTTTTLFTTRYVVDDVAFIDRNYTNVDAHELAHHWFGDLITAESSTHHWLQEGFATYYALLAERDIFGDDYFYAKLYDTAQQIKFASRTDAIPVLNAKASSLTFYEKGAWTLFVLHEFIGDKAFKKAIKSYLKKYAFKNVNTQNFFDEIKKVSDFDVVQFQKTWLESTAFDTPTANALLSKNKAIKARLEVDKLKKTPLSEKIDFLKQTLDSDVHFSVKQAVISQLQAEKYENKKELLLKALQQNNIQLRQTLAGTLPAIPEDFRKEYETLLDDKSYETQEIALFYLWKNFPNHRKEYLDKSKEWIGFNDYNLRTLWLSLALSTPEYSDEPEKLINELVSFSTPEYEATTRQNALEKLIAFKFINDDVLTNLVNATTHHMWQFSKFGRETIRVLLKNSEMRTSFNRILPNLNPDEQFQLDRLLKE
ncbi:M1 family metallopeptidase [Flavobacterium johnsoniae]|uniref:Aminopeptidase N n=1 Tax=Flavobacterium johnsoniae (strain ATCC 17061 / DSM 2064 / JCM 8514 / BCRC 14874 / CCUG 350202 / NBRC 14942 / NCIMB 11054 / UW101) TaxID=376686 RepID=A5FFR3_FLAJ1|nr:M1 family metallopeptidase [Flavobacterium johnsoniae]ABQ05949.1 peptidase family M1, membrane alanine aminopeptidase [Flavobacterium johnsoniae UW101]OXE95486.1 aminopeptidase [Flavobacterium johnsoniae UW101]WQG81687.1 M1 family metallopeptidase [Flavobacterium johnsoniae UW101]SHK61009.1 aminopeptidase N [Flavobacterium johnsoniae]